MIQQTFNIDTASLMSKITALYEYFLNNQDERTAERARDLAIKLDKTEYSIAFCGHFSAGKSSMINKIIGEKLLPSSPIPTSANLVKIKSGEDYAKVIFKQGKPRIYFAPYDFDKVKTYCQDGDQIKTIEISYSSTNLPGNTVIMDTPGIDSTDDAHRIATESAMHLADLVFYVMDYNHVQSELNFLFTKELITAGKKVYLIINQIDKHRDEELSFDQFKQSVRESFAAWGVEPEEIFYTSLRDESHKYNEFQALQNFIKTMAAKRNELLPASIFQSLTKLTNEHLVYLQEKNSNAAEKYEKKLAELSVHERESLDGRLDEIKNKLRALESSLVKTESKLNRKEDDILQNAYLMPFQTRELAKNYIESRQANFKIGFFFSRQKTLAERKNRLEQFYKDLSEKIKSQLDWHLRQLYMQEIKANEIHDTQLLAKVQEFQVDIKETVLTETVKQGAQLSGDYVLQYTNDVVDSVKKIAKRDLKELREIFLQAVKLKNSYEQKLLENEQQKLANYAEAFRGLITIKQKLINAQTAAQAILNDEFTKTEYAEKTAALLSDTVEEAEVVYETKEESAEKKATALNINENRPLEEKTQKIDTKMIISTINKLTFAASSLQNVPGFKKIAAELMEKAERLKNKQFTVALFGAFSAGKSSFANALIGEKVLPVSPNPTTAAINKIMPVNDEHEHGKVLVKLKKADVLFADVNRSLKVFALTAADFDDAVEKTKKVISGKDEFDANEKTHFAFLNAFLKGVSSFRQLLGTVIETDLEEFEHYVAQEEKSCFVELIEVYYDCELTRKGITLVDTPGADSINARHTGVAFDYIKSSDAILFVTYYNHAFSKADREFLIQLGRVKDSFELDKMFFIVNAIDLANNEAEMESVLEYVEGQLVQYGIRHPHLFGLSSLKALAEKLDPAKGQQSKIAFFEERFYAFITNELMEISYTAAELAWQRALEQLRAFIQSSQDNKEIKAQKRNQLEKEKTAIKEIIEKQSPDIFLHRLEQEASELIYYIKQRVFLRYGDFVKESFNPALLKDNGHDLKKALHTALTDFLYAFGFDFAQELRATTLRIEAFIGKLLVQTQESVTKLISEINTELSFSPFETERMEGIEFDTAFTDEDTSQFKSALVHFKNPKVFFEKGGRKKLSAELEELISEPADQYLEIEGKRLKSHYQGLFAEEFQRLTAFLGEQADEYYAGLLAVLSDDFSIEHLEKTEKEISNYGL